MKSERQGFGMGFSKGSQKAFEPAFTAGQVEDYVSHLTGRPVDPDIGGPIRWLRDFRVRTYEGGTLIVEASDGAAGDVGDAVVRLMAESGREWRSHGPVESGGEFAYSIDGPWRP